MAALYPFATANLPEAIVCCVLYMLCYVCAVVGKNRRRHSKTLKVDPALLEFGAASSTFAESEARRGHFITADNVKARPRTRGMRQPSISAAVISSCDPERTLAFELSPPCYLQSIAPALEWFSCAASLYPCSFPL